MVGLAKPSSDTCTGCSSDTGGASPSAVAQTARLQHAKRLLDTTILPIAEIALASGFGSLRRFNAVFADATVAGRTRSGDYAGRR